MASPAMRRFTLRVVNKLVLALRQEAYERKKAASKLKKEQEKTAKATARNHSYVQKMLSLPKLIFTEQVWCMSRSKPVFESNNTAAAALSCLYLDSIALLEDSVRPPHFARCNCKRLLPLQMLRFMLQDGVPEILISFITQVKGAGDEEGPVCRPKRGGPLTEELKKSYRWVWLREHRVGAIGPAHPRYGGFGLTPLSIPRGALSGESHAAFLFLSVFI
jgi:hypothetical protein